VIKVISDIDAFLAEMKKQAETEAEAAQETRDGASNIRSMPTQAPIAPNDHAVSVVKEEESK
jgi:hypothetical protein